MTLKLVIKIIIAAIIYVLYKIINYTAYIEYNSLAIDQMRNEAETIFVMQAYNYILNYSWIVVAIILPIMFCEDIIKLIEIIKEKNK